MSFLGSLAMVAAGAAQTKDYPQASASKAALGQISGHVYRSDTQEPIPKAQVELSAADQETAKAAGPERIVRTGGDGAFVFLDLPAGRYQFEVWRNGFAEFSWQQVADQDNEKTAAERPVSLKPGQKVENVALHLHPAGVIAGQVSDEDRDAVPGLQVFALRIDFIAGGRRRVGAIGRSVTNDLGNFRMPNLPPGSYYVSAGGLIGRPMEEVGLKQGPAGKVQYHNTFYPGTPLLDEAQAVSIGPLAETGNIRFMVHSEKTYTITGKVLPGGSGRKHADQVDCSGRETAGYTFSTGGRTAQIEPDGSFRISDLPPGEYTLSAKAVNQGVSADVGFASVRIVDSDVRANIDTGRAAVVSGKAEAPPGLSLAGTRIQLETFGSGFYLLHQAPGIDPSGRFTITNVPPGEYTFGLQDVHGEWSTYIKKAVCGGRDYASREFTLPLGTTLDCDVVLASDTGVVRGKVTSGENPAPGLVVALIPQSSELRHLRRYTLTAETDAAGQYRITGVIPGDYLLFAVPRSADHEYFALDFADRHTNIAEHVSLGPSVTQVVNLSASQLE
ncbi:MAG: carboxypeptidase-like regulatory domain-containing protein [Terriglobales bacterium]